MWIPREIADILQQNTGSYVQILLGPRQCGKSSLFAYLGGDQFHEISFDDLQTRTLANQDPALFLSQQPLPLLIDEAQYAPNIFPEIKQIVDRLKKRQLLSTEKQRSKVLFRLTGSNQILMDKQVKESLVGRASYYYLNTLSLHEIQQTFPNISIPHILFHGGWPELYTNQQLSLTQYLNDYIRQYLEKDIVLSAGITKQHEFHTVLGMLAARTGNLLNYSAIAKDSGVRSITVKEWGSLLERMDLIYLLPPYRSNLNKRLVKSPKLYFLDTGLCVRLQGWAEQAPFMQSPQAGPMFETLVLSEIIKYKRNHSKDWKISFWRTKTGEEIDFIIENKQGETLALDAKMGIHAVQAKSLPPEFKKSFTPIKQLILISIGGKKTQLSTNCLQLPITELAGLLSGF